MPAPMVTNLAKFWMDEIGVTHILFFQRTEFDDKDVEEYIKTAQSFSGGKPSLVLIDYSNISYLSLGALKRFVSPDLIRLTTAAALVVNSSSPFVAGAITFLMTLTKEPFPMKVFTNEKEGMDWLLTFRK
ncbi:MAG: hypothetical protein WCW44_04520 [archaeon]